MQDLGLFVSPMMDTACSPQDLTTSDGIATGLPGIGRARFDGLATLGGRTITMMNTENVATNTGTRI